MKHLLNTLYVTTQGAYLAREGETIVVRIEHETKLRVPIHTLSGVVCFGQVSMSPPLMALCAEKAVGVSFLSTHGRFLARVEGPVSGNVLLRREQYRRADNEKHSTAVARSVVAGKIANGRTVLLRALRDHESMGGREEVERASTEMGRSIARLEPAVSLDVVRGIEGEAASLYFNVFDNLVVAQKEDFSFRGRSRRPPLDNLNALLSFVYTLLVHDVESALEGVGLDPSVGFLHRDRPGRAGLALDLMEELRPVLADRLVLSLVNRQQVRAKGFAVSETGAVSMDDDTRKEVLVSWQKRKQDEIVHPFIEEKIPLGLVPHVQALLLARHLRGDLDAYPPFFWR
ncbi:MAG: type I-C CRISPR-associated endonuclease Cas1c [Deltaproteobacteria bacterium]|nr:type I-C CRISPR-associated endonuclease Cas1c [Deltaproteobacteria bacterium]